MGMQKVYLLLRNNQQSGPYSLEEILQLNLKPFDLVWMEGRSAAWRYPGEIESLRPYVPEAPQPELPFKPIATAALDDASVFQRQVPTPVNTSKKIFVSLPGKMTAAVAEGVNEKREDEKRPVQENLVYPKERTQATIEEPPLQTNYSRSLNQVEEDYTKWIVEKKTKKKSKLSRKDLLIVVGVFSIVLLGYFIFSRPSVINSLPVQQQAVTMEKTVPAPAPANEEVQVLNSEPDVNANANEPAHKTKAVQRIRNSSSNTSPIPSPTNTNEKANEVPIVSVPGEDVVVNENRQQENKEVSQPKQEKKKLGEVLKGIFSKKEKKQAADPVDEEPAPARNRQATRRNQEDPPGNSATDFATLSSMIDISSNAPDNWMMGITGLKLSLRNNNSVALQSATVTVFYYDNNNQLLEKKLIYFNNVASHGTMTVAAPDHKFADHVSFKLTTATAREDRYATR